LKRAIKGGNWIEERDDKGNTILHGAVKWGSLEAV